MKRDMRSGGRALPPDHRSLAYGIPKSPTGTLYVRSLGGGMSLRPREGREILFGRNSDHVHVCVGGDDQRVSRRQGAVRHQDNRWWVRNTGQLPIRLPGSLMLFTDEEPIPLAEGYTPLFVRGSGGREHLLELYVAGNDGKQPPPRPSDPTVRPQKWQLDPDERLVLIVLGQRYLLHEARPQPLTWSDTVRELKILQPGIGWTTSLVAHKVAAVRERLSRGGVSGLTEAEVGQPVGNALNDNLIKELLLSTTLVPPDIAALDGAFPD